MKIYSCRKTHKDKTHNVFEPVDYNSGTRVLRSFSDHAKAVQQARWRAGQIASGDVTSAATQTLVHRVLGDLSDRMPNVVINDEGHGTASAALHGDAQRLCWTLRQRQAIFRLLLQDFGQMIGTMAKEHCQRAGPLWRLAVESWLRHQGLISVRQNQEPKVSTTFPEIWSQN